MLVLAIDAVVVEVVVVAVLGGNNYLRGLWETFLLLLLDMVGLVDDRLLLLHLSPIPPLLRLLLRFWASLLLLRRLPLGQLTLCSALSSPYFYSITIVSMNSNNQQSDQIMVNSRLTSGEGVHAINP